jgi:hypothetical protein
MLTRNKVLVLFACSILLGSLQIFPSQVNAINSTTDLTESTSNEYLFFSDSFEGSTVDTEKWQVTLNTQMNDNPAYGGVVQVKDSYIELSSSGSTFPWVCTKENPFPNKGYFIVKFDLTYGQISDFGDGLLITKGDSLTWSENGSSSTYIFQLWADNDGSFSRTKMSIYLLGEECWVSYVDGWEPDAPTHNFELSYQNGVYSVNVDGVQVASAESDVRPNNIGFGHPPAYYVPFSGEHLSTLLGGWTKFKIDSIEVITSATEATEPSESAQISQGFAIESNSTVSAFTFDNSGNIPQICFGVSGPEGTTGYVEITITKTFMPNSDIDVYLDGTQIDYQLTATENSWIVTFTYHHSSHLVAINSVAYIATSPSAFPDWIWNITIVTVAVMVIAATGILVWLTKHK